ncbi:thioredoxin family protein [Flavobacteriaceae bacterium D16]|nr:thioredoxin family protein [Flavobacteriaceae bacterium D16]
MKFFFLTTLICLLSSCADAQSPIKEIQLDTGEYILLGAIKKEALQTGTYGDWYTSYYAEYQTDDTLIDKFQNELKAYDILLFMGTWCSDSQREVPRFIKILEKAGFPEDQLKIVALDKRDEFYKKSPGGEEWGLNINLVPTFIFLKEGKEVGRIVEFPDNTLEMDMQAIVTNK